MRRTVSTLEIPSSRGVNEFELRDQHGIENSRSALLKMDNDGSTVGMQRNEIMMRHMSDPAIGQMDCEGPKRLGFDRFLDLLSSHVGNVSNGQNPGKFPDFRRYFILKNGNTTSVAMVARNNRLTTAFRRKKAFCTQFKLRRRASQCSITRQKAMSTTPTT